MITEKELLLAIKECEAEPITASKVGKLADFYVIYDHLFGSPYVGGHSEANKVEKQLIETNGDTEFLRAINGKEAKKVLPIIDELMEAVKTLHPRMYDRVLEKISDI